MTSDNNQLNGCRNREVWYHAPCRDGFTGAYAAWRYYGDQATYHPVFHKKPLPELSADTEFLDVIDFALTTDQFLDYQNRLGVNNILILDHHLETQQNLVNRPGVVVDLNRSGAMIAYQHYFEDDNPPLLYQYVQDCDLSTWALENTQEINAVIAACKQNWDSWRKLEHELENNFAEQVQWGQIIVNHHRHLSQEAVESAFFTTIGGFSVPVAERSAPNRQLTEALFNKFPDAPFVATYKQRGDEVFWSLRSANQDEFDVGQIARDYGGGGHPGAAGFISDSRGDVYWIFKRLLTKKTSLGANKFLVGGGRGRNKHAINTNSV